MYPNRAALGNNGNVRRAGRFLLLPMLVVVTALSACNKGGNQGPVAPPSSGFNLRGFVFEQLSGDETAVGAVLVEVTSGPSSGTSTTTDADGRFSIPGVSGQLNLRLTRDGWVPTGTTVNVTEDTFVRVELTREESDEPDETFTLSGVVVRGQGDMDPIGGAVVEVVDGPRAGDTSTTDALGRYSLPGLFGDVTVRASFGDLAPREKSVEVNEDMTLFLALFTPPQVSMCLDLDDEEVHITNDDEDNELVLTDWVLRETIETHSFTFVEDRECRASMSGLIVAPGATVIITSGEDPEHSPPTHVAGWCDLVWDNDGDTARLFDLDDLLIVQAVGSFDNCGG